MVDSSRRGGARDLYSFACIALVCAVSCVRTAAAACPAGQVELLPNIRALPAAAISMLDASNMRFAGGTGAIGSGAQTIPLKRVGDIKPCDPKTCPPPPPPPK